MKATENVTARILFSKIQSVVKKELFHAVWKKKGVKERTDAKTADLRRSFGVGAVE